jgi:hypothetical protein
VSALLLAIVTVVAVGSVLSYRTHTHQVRVETVQVEFQAKSEAIIVKETVQFESQETIV